jgi:hypothetical protein
MVNLREVGILGEPLKVDWKSVARLPGLKQFSAFVYADSVPERRALESLCKEMGKIVIDVDVKGAKKTPMIVVRFADAEE